MKYFIDTEFCEMGAHHPIDLISIGIVAEDGREFYRQSLESYPELVNDWVEKNVLPHLVQCPTGWSLQAHRSVGGGILLTALKDEERERCPHPSCPWYTLREIKAGIIAFIGDDPQPEFWGYFADYDWVVFCQIMGRMIDLPKGWPKHCKDIKQWQVDLGRPRLPEYPKGGEHHALADAHWNKMAWEFLNKIAAERFIRS